MTLFRITHLTASRNSYCGSAALSITVFVSIKKAGSLSSNEIGLNCFGSSLNLLYGNCRRTNGLGLQFSEGRILCQLQ